MEAILIIIFFFAILAALVGTAALARKRRVRITGAVVAFLWTCLMFVAADLVERFNYNVWYSLAASKLLKASVAGLKAGQKDAVLVELKRLSDELEVTYERRGNFKELAERAVMNLATH